MNYKLLTGLLSVLLFATLAYAFELNTSTPKEAPVGEDLIGIEDSENGWQLKAVELENLPISVPTQNEIDSVATSDGDNHDFTGEFSTANAAKHYSGRWAFSNEAETFTIQSIFTPPTASRTVLFGDFDQAVPAESSVNPADGVIYMNAITDTGKQNITIYTVETCATALAESTDGDICIGN